MKSFKRIFLFLMILMLFIISFSAVKSVSIRTKNIDTWEFNVSQDYAIITPGVILNGNLFSATVKNDTNPATIYADIRLDVLSGDWAGDYLIVRFGPIELSPNEIFVLKNTEILDYLDKVALKENNMTHVSNLQDTSDFLNLELAEGKYSLNIKIIEVVNDEEVDRGDKTADIAIIKPDPIEFIVLPEGDTLLPIIKWSLSRVPWYSTTKSVLEIEENGKLIYSHAFNHNKPDSNNLDLDIKGYPTGDNIEDGIFTYNITGADDDPVFKRGKTYTLRVIMKDSGNNEIAKTLDEKVTFDITYPELIYPAGEIDNVNPTFEWSFEYDNEVSYYLLQIENIGNFKVYGSQSYELEKSLEWGKTYKWKVIPYYENNTPFINPDEIEWVEFNTPMNNPPEIQIINPSDGEFLVYGKTYTFEGEAIDNDPQDGISETWWEIEGKRFEGNAIDYTPKRRYMDSPLNIKFYAKDNYNNISQSEINVFVKQPKLKIIKPQNGMVFSAGEEVEFEAFVQDLEEDLVWYDNGNEIGSGESITYTFDESGEHEIEVKSGELSDSVIIQIELVPLLQSEETEFEVYVNDPVTLNVDYANLDPGEINWILNNRVIGNGSDLEYTFKEPGNYIVIARYKELSVTFNIYVKAIPEIRIVSPLKNARLMAGEEVLLRAEGENVEEEIIWYLDEEEIGKGKEINYTFSIEDEGVHSLSIESGVASYEISIEIYVDRYVKIVVPEERLIVLDINQTFTFKAEKKNINEEIQWFINNEFVNSGDTFEYTFEDSGEYNVKAKSGDFSDEIVVKVVGEKYLIIKTPIDGAKFEIGQKIEFVADSKNLKEELRWFVNNNEIGTGERISYSFDESGTYEIKVVSGELESSIAIEILPQEVLNIVSPLNNEEFYIGEEITFEVDVENLRGDVQWFANDTLIGSGEVLNYTFNRPGEYEIKAKSPTKERTIRIKILESQTLKIILPEDGDIFKFGDTINLKAETKYETTIEWYINDEYIGEGKDLGFIPEESGTYEIKSVADDIEKVVQIYVYKPVSNLSIEGINNNSIFFKDETIDVNAVYEFDEEIGIKEQKWLLDGELISKSKEITLSNMSVGKHVLIFKVMDNMNNSIENVVEFTVLDRIEFKIVSPEEGSHFNLNDSIRLKIELLNGKWDQIKEINWYFNGNKIVSGRDALVSNVGEGDIVVKVELIDILDEVYTKEININISDKPILDILEPINNSTFKYGEEIKVVGNVYQTTLEGKTNLNTDDILWYLDGTEVGNGGVIFLDGLETGVHTIQAEYGDLVSEIKIEVLEPLKAKILESQEFIFNPGEDLLIKGEGDGELTWYLNGNEIGKGSVLTLNTQNISTQAELTLKAVFGEFKSEDSITLLPNSKPIIVWDSPENEEKFVTTANISINVKAEDKEDGLLPYELFVDGVNIGENVDSLFAGTLKPGTHNLKVLVKDKLNTEAVESRNIIINQKPNPTIISPQNNQEITAGMSLILEAIVQDDDSINEEKIIWMIDGEEVGRGLKVEYTGILTTGEHFVDLYVEDSMGESVQLSSNIQIVEKPNIRIIQPINDSIVNVGDKLILQAEAFKGPNLPYEDEKVSWKLDGSILGNGKRIELNTNILSSGEHAITAEVENVSDTVRIKLNTPPAIDIVKPMDGSVLSTKDLIIFESIITDSEDNVRPENVVWFINGEQKGTGISFNAGTLKPGDYRIIAKVTDNNGLTGEKAISIKVVSPLTANIISPEDKVGFSQTDVINLNVNISGGLEPYDILWTIKQPNVEDKKLDGNNLKINAYELEYGNALVSVDVKDSLGNIYTETKQITIFEKIKIKIVKPITGQVFVKGQEKINAVAQIFNAEGKNPDIEWFINDQKVGNGLVLSIDTNTFESGNYVLKVIAKAQKDEDSDIVNIAIRDKLKMKILSTYNIVKSSEEIELKGFALDPIDGDINNINWSSNLQGDLGTGKNIKVKLIPGKHIITAVAKNSKGFVDKDTINILSLGEMRISIDSPSNGDVFTGAVEIPFKAIVIDADGTKIPSENIIWISNIDGQIGRGSEINKKLSKGEHEITLSAMSKYNGSITKKISIQVLEEVKIERDLVINIEEGLLIVQGQPIELSAYKMGIDDDIIWTSDIEGELGVGDTIEAVLTVPGEHEIIATAGEISKSVKVKVIPYEEKRNVLGVVVALKGNASIKYKDQINDLKLMDPLYAGDTLVIYNDSEIKIVFTTGVQKIYTINTNEGVKFANRREISFNE
ncbi:hypothetical protein XO12_08195 [Marinitoga sp. 1154]|uniref:hypothetical protein n=1 Tax=Marinitoga sp. 1154 TaxID=1643335 RepID=UPI001586EB1E|nr:hypothetical protein [Marinitoga sp. 1154]NUV00069.1 hypothetical protein [Marinitoga sp. 1154]